MWKRAVTRYGIWLGIALFVGAQNVLVRVSRGTPIDLQWDVFHELVYWSVWALFAQIVLRMVRRWPFDRGMARRSLVPHL
ncbi:MAG TPA: hypothetical protein VFI79_04455, partial [Gemmatimonadales bacterium]|nr:hypothetical protein [Gemmatimonadales bacterium]